MTAPTTHAEYLARFAANQYIDGYYIETTTHMPCPFCAAADFMAPKILEVETVLAAGATCIECGRSAKALFERDANGVRFEIVQTAGPDQPEWLVPHMRRVDSASKPEGYADLADLPEDERIRIVGEYVTMHGKTVGLCVDDVPAKIERYSRKLRQRFPGIVILDTTKGPVAGVVTIRVGPQ